MKRLLRAFRVGPRLLRLRRAIDFGMKVELDTYAAKRRFLKAIGTARPLSSGAGMADCFMLLDEARIWEGLWSLYTFRVHFGACRLVVLNDGTLTGASMERLRSLFPGIEIPDFARNDVDTLQHLSGLGALRCREWRKRFVFFRKLIDPVLLAKSDNMILLDSDCLHFQPPRAIQEWAAAPNRLRFIGDVRPFPFCTSPAEFARICGAPALANFCAGYLCVPRKAVDFGAIERYLTEEPFERQLSTGRFQHVAEQTLYAMVAAVTGAEILPAEYATCPDIPQQDAVMGHFCGGTYRRTWLYTKGLPRAMEHLAAHGFLQHA